MKKGITLVTRRVYLIAQALTNNKAKPTIRYDQAADIVAGLEDQFDLDEEKTWTEWDEHYGNVRSPSVRKG